MLTKTKIKWINSLERKKNRDEEGVFVAEGYKLVAELLPKLKCRFIAISDENILQKFDKNVKDIEVISAQEYKKISFQKSPQGILGVFEKPVSEFDIHAISNNLNLALDEIQDPGNLGTILRLADWFGIKDVFCSKNTADAFSPKAVQATMGAIGRVNIHYVDLPELLLKADGKLPIYGTFLNGDNIFNDNLSKNGIIILGNEGNGISPEVEQLVTKRISIPKYPIGKNLAESLNVGIAAAIVVAEFRRNTPNH
ncbi:MAG: RNA methyltransferase [Porphyromonadaceae bacterium]|nr:RNA methyltransferase [Porphyromonadaceae bacterium]